MKRTIVRQWLHIGDRECCQLLVDKYDYVIHIWRDDMPQHDCSAKNRVGDFSLHYVDGKGLSEGLLTDIASAVQKNAVSVTRRSSAKILVHCIAGVTRSPTIALFVLSVVERRHPLLLIGEVYFEHWLQSEITANICRTPLQDIVAWWEKHIGDN